MKDTSGSTVSYVRFCADYRAATVRTARGSAWGRKRASEGAEAEDDERLAWHVSFAFRVADELPAFRRAVTFSRPATLGADLAVHSLLSEARGAKGSKASKAAARTFYDWRWQIVEAEAKDAANVEHLLRIAHRAAPAPHAAPICKLIRAHVEREFDVRVPWPFSTELEIGDYARRATRREATMPSWLFFGRRPPRYLLSPDGRIVQDTDA